MRRERKHPGSGSPETGSPDSELRRERSLIADLDGVIWEADAQTMTFTFVSEGATRILGYTPQEWLADPSFWADHLHPDDREEAISGFARTATSRERFDAEYRFLAKSGTVVRLRDVGHVLLDVENGTSVIRGLMTEITKRRELEAGRTDDARRFRRVVEQLPAIVYLESVETDPMTLGRLLYVSPQVEQILGFSPKEWEEDPAAWARQFHPDDKERIDAAYRQAEQTGEPLVAEYRMYSRDARVVWFRDEAVLVSDEEGKPAYWQGILYDITAQRAGEERVRETEMRYQALVEQLPTITYLDALEGPVNTLYISPQTTDVLGYTPQDWYDDPDLWSKIVHPDDRERNTVVSTEFPVDTVYRMIAKNGREVWVHDQARPITDEKGTPMFWQGVLVDITEQKRAGQLERDLEHERQIAERLRAADEMKNTFLQAVSHDLRTPLAAILGLAITLAREDLDVPAEESRDMARRIAQNARKLDRIVTDLLDLERLTRGIVSPDFQPIDVGELIREFIAGSPLVIERRLQLDTAPVVIPIDAAMVERILENLLGNAVKHTPGDARIWVRVEDSPEGALIAVEDNGPGVSPAEREMIFEAFRQGSSPGAAGGAGVGLALVTRFAELHSGRAWVEDRRGGGASFRVLLSAEPAGWEPRSGPADTTGPGSGGTPAAKKPKRTTKPRAKAEPDAKPEPKVKTTRKRKVAPEENGDGPAQRTRTGSSEASQA
jgi:PAS domain S-box-containing protein